MEDVYTMHVLHEGENEPEPAPMPEPAPEPVCDCPQMELAQAYVRPQPIEGIFPLEDGLRMGTVFPNLSRPYVGRNEGERL